MSVAKLFWQDPYLCRLGTRIASVAGNDVTLAETIFYAFSGGQESDAGAIGGKRVLDARKDARDIVDTLGDGHGLQVGDAVTVEIGPIALKRVNIGKGKERIEIRVP